MKPQAIFITLAFIALFGISAAAQTTAFTYQGKLNDMGAAANGQYQITFKLYDAADGGSQVGSTLTDVAVNVTDGGKFSPGNSPGTVTTGSTNWNSGGSYVVEIGASSYDLWQVTGQLNLNSTAGHPFTIALTSLDDLIFDSTSDHTWEILNARDGIGGLDSDLLALDVSGFKADFGSGRFWFASTTNDLVINFSAVPEPAAAMLLLMIASSLLVRRRLC